MRRSTEGPRIVIEDPDPYLASLIRQEFPGAVLHAEFEDREGEGSNGSNGAHPDLLIVGVDSAEELHELSTSTKVPIVGVIDGTKVARSIKHEPHDMLIRPFLPSEVHRVVRAALRMRRRPVAERFSISRGRLIVAAARVIGVVIAAVLVLVTPAEPPPVALIGVAMYSLARLFLRRGRILTLLDVVVAGTAIATTGGINSVLAPFGLIVSVGAGFELGSYFGAMAGLVVAVSGAQAIAHGLAGGSIPSVEAASWFAFFAAGGFTGGAATRIGFVRGSAAAEIAAEANQVLSSLFRIARAMPGGLEPGIIADSVLTEIREGTGAPAAVMLVRRGGIFGVAGSYGLVHPAALDGSDWEQVLTRSLQKGAAVMSRESLPAGGSAWNSFTCMICAPIRRDSTSYGLIVAACPDHSLHARNTQFLTELAQASAVAVENAELFARVRELSVDEERQRLARELHDGVAQALTHLRLELDLLKRRESLDEIARADIDRMSRVVMRAGVDVREMIFGLRSPVASEGLDMALRAHLRDLRRFGGPEIDFRFSGILRPTPRVESEVFRIVQEAVSNALHHAQARVIKVALTVGIDELRLVVEDDGTGFDHNGASNGVGLKAMSERAQRIGATLRIARGEQGGTKVELVRPVREEDVA